MSKAMMATLFVLVPSFLPAGASPKPNPQPRSLSYIFCAVGDKDDRRATRMYFSNIFSGDAEETSVLSKRYVRFVQLNVDPYVYGRVACLSSGDESAARAMKEKQEATWKQEKVSIVETEWNGSAIWSSTR